MKMAQNKLLILLLGMQTIIKTLMNSAMRMVRQVNKNQVKMDRGKKKAEKRKRRKESGGQNSPPILIQAQTISVKLMSLLMALLTLKMHQSTTRLHRQQVASILLITLQLVSRVVNFLVSYSTIKSSQFSERQSIKSRVFIPRVIIYKSFPYR